MNIGRYESAGEVLESVGYFEKAVDAYIQASKFERAKSCAQQVRPIELQNMLIDKIQGLQRNRDIEGGRYDKLGG